MFFVRKEPLYQGIYYHLVMVILLGGMSCSGHKDTPFSKSAIEDLASFELADGFKIELIASEPLIFDPVDMMIDEYGRLYVVEMPGMPLNKSGLGKVVLLSDTSGDGQMDKRTVFADSLILPSGIMRWKKGVIVTDPPNVYYFEDNNQDGKADIKKVMLTGFDTSNLEANVNNPQYGLDNWIYLADLPVGGKGGIHFTNDSGGVQVPESTVRFKPESHQLEVLSGQTQFGQTFDAWGHLLMVSNSNHIYQDVIAARYLKRNPDMVAPSATETLAGHKKVFPITKNPEYQMLTDVGVFTSACGNVAYLGGAFPEEYNNVVFVCEPVSNVVHADRLVSNGVTFKAERIWEQKEFLASTDPYARLVNLYIGPDGALYVVDFYRQVIEGPEFMAKEVLDTIDLYNGTHKGRIYRISAEDAPAAKWIKGLNLRAATSQELVEKLTDQNIWWRLNAQRLLVDRKDETVIPALVKVATSSKSPMGRLHALWTLEGLGRLSADLIRKALQDPVAGVRENAIKLAELHLDKVPTLASALLKLQDDPDPKVRFQLLLTLGYLNTPEANGVRQALLFNNMKDKWVQIAALSASSSQALALLEAVLSKFDPDNTAYSSMVNRLGAIIGKSQKEKTINQLIQKATDSSGRDKWRAPLLNGLAKGIRNRGEQLNEMGTSRYLLIHSCLESPSITMKRASLEMLRAIGLSSGRKTSLAMKKAVQEAKNKQLQEAKRACAIDFLALRNPEEYAGWLKTLISPQEPLQVQLAALNALKIIPGMDASRYLLGKWSSLSPGVRTAAVYALMMNEERIALLLKSIEMGRVNLSDINWSQSVRLRSLGNMELRMWARELFAKKDEKLKSLIQDYQTALALDGNPEKGKAVFQQNCGVCHQVAGKMGRAFGPDLGTVHAWAAADILSNILDPNRSIAHGYDTWKVLLNSGETMQGIISSESPTSITLSDANGQVSHIARQDIKSLIALHVSAMPIGLEEKIDKQEMADLLSFLRHGDGE